jgi:hypothetical protein
MLNSIVMVFVAFCLPVLAKQQASRLVISGDIYFDVSVNKAVTVANGLLACVFPAVYTVTSLNNGMSAYCSFSGLVINCTAVPSIPSMDLHYHLWRWSWYK